MGNKSAKAASFNALRIASAKRAAMKRCNRQSGADPLYVMQGKLRARKPAKAEQCESCRQRKSLRPKLLESGKPFETYFHQLSHDLRTPLNHINGFAEVLLMADSLDEHQADYVRCILRASTELQAAVLAHLDEVDLA